MAAINFPNSPTVGDIYVDNGAAFQWDGEKWKAHELDSNVFSSAKNQTGSTLVKGTPVYVNGTIGNSGLVTVAPMIANGTITSKMYLGIVGDDISNGSDGHITSFGYINSINTTGSTYSETWTEGQILYISQTTAGYLTNVLPTSGLVLPVAVVVNVHANNGTLIVRSDPAISATAEQGILANTALQPGDNISELTNDAGYATQSAINTAVTATASSTSSNLKVPFLNTTGNTTGVYGFLHDSSTNFTYNPGTNTLNYVTLGTSVTLPVAAPNTVGGVWGDIRNTTYSGYGYRNIVLGQGNSANTYVSNCAGIGHGISISSYANYSVAVGDQVNIASTGTTAVGYYTRGYSSTQYSTLIGAEASAASGSQFGTAIGWFAKLSGGSYSTALGADTQAYGNYSIALGAYARTGGYDYTTVIHNGNNYFTADSAGFFVTGITAGTSSDVLYYDSTTKKITYGTAPSGGGGALSDLTDVTISSPTSGQVLMYNGSGWVNADAGSTPPVVQDVYRSTRIAPTGMNRNGSYNLEVYFASNAEAVHVREMLIAISMTTSSATVTFRSSSQQCYLNSFDSNMAGWSSVNGTTLYINNYYVGGPGFNSYLAEVQIGFGPANYSTTPTELVVDFYSNPAFDAFTNPWLPHGIAWFDGNAGQHYLVRPSTSPTTTPAITAQTYGNPATWTYTLDTTNNPSLLTSLPGTVVLIPGKYELVDPNAPVPWYSVESGFGTTGTFTLPDGYDRYNAFKLTAIGNFPGYSGGSQYFYPSGMGNPVNSLNVGSVWDNNQTAIYIDQNYPPAASPFSYNNGPNGGIAAAWAVPMPSTMSTTAQYTMGNFDGSSGFFANGNTSGIANNNAMIPTSGGTVKWKCVVILSWYNYQGTPTITVNPTYYNQSGTLYEEFSFTDMYYSNTTRYIFFTITNDTLARAAAADPNNIMNFSFNMECAYWAWYERAI